MALGFAVVYWGNEHAIIEMFLRRSPGLVRRIVYNITNLIVLCCAIVLIPGGVKLFRLQVKTIPLGGLFFPRAYYYALPIIAMGALLFVTSAFRTAEYAITGDDSIMTSTPAEGGVNVD
jgi:TRAP-type C4-dicarboxylate transport system permease small subunit